MTDQIDVMKVFYRDVMQMEVKLVLDEYVEFVHDGVRFAISTHSVMQRTLGDARIGRQQASHVFELAFCVSEPSDVDAVYKRLIHDGATPIAGPAEMPWGQRTAFFADPDGNIHEVFADL